MLFLLYLLGLPLQFFKFSKLASFVHSKKSAKSTIEPVTVKARARLRPVICKDEETSCEDSDEEKENVGDRIAL